MEEEISAAGVEAAIISSLTKENMMESMTSGSKMRIPWKKVSSPTRTKPLFG